MADPRIINYAGEQKIYNKEKVDELLDTKQDTLVPDTTVQDSANVVANTAVKAYVDAETQRAESTEGDLNDLNTTDKSSLVAAINEVKDSAYTVDEHVTADSTNPVQNTGVKEYVDTQNEATLQSAKDYTDDKVGELDTTDGTTVVELTGHLSDLNSAAESLVTAINNIDGRVEHNATLITSLDSGLNNELAAERQVRSASDQALDIKITQVEQALDTKITQVEQAKQDKLTFDNAPTHGSDNPVTSAGTKAYVDEITGQLDDLDIPAESLVTAINQLGEKYKDPDTIMSSTSENAVQNKVIKEYIDDRDATPTENSKKAVVSDGIYKAIRKAGVKIGEIMDWPQFHIEKRVMTSDSQFDFTFNGLLHRVVVEPKDVELEIADNVPEGWKAMDGSVELDADTNQGLADFFGGHNTTIDGKIWIPYLPRKIIKVAY
ncbi:MAG: hypothetical protein UIM53_03915 [Acutalibacteraceae bacterium]|nr:hypothetical protein [Acutalibacteraceae bacterium]